MSDAIEPGFCQCGCGERTKIADQTRESRGWVKGEPIRYIRGHHKRGKKVYDDGLSASLRYYRRNRERRLAAAKERYRQDPDLARSCSLKRKYGITLADFDRMYDEQAGCCAACEVPIPRRGKGTQVDHCHETGRVRGLLCIPCNTNLGYYDEDVDRIRGLLRYAEEQCGARSSLDEVGL